MARVTQKAASQGSRADTGNKIYGSAGFDLAVKKQLKWLGKNLSAFREQARLSQKQVNELVGISVATLSRLESGKDENPRLDTLVALSMVYKVDMIDLLLPTYSRGAEAVKAQAYVKRAKGSIEKSAKELQQISKSLE